MKVVVTGASGGLGSQVVRLLHEGGHEVQALDMADRGNLPVKTHVVTLVDRVAVDRLITRADAVVHLGNHTDFTPPDPQLILNENLAMNTNVFQAAANAGAQRIVFASSIQVVSSIPSLPKEDDSLPPPPLPLDSDTPANPTNPYALSKHCGEKMLDYYAYVHRIGCVSIRYPWMSMMDKFRAAQPHLTTSHRWLQRLAYSYMTYKDGARLVVAILEAETLGAGSGSRVYLPASKGNAHNLPAAELIRRHMPCVSLKRRIEHIPSVVDVSRITRETGWEPLDNEIV